MNPKRIILLSMLIPAFHCGISQKVIFLHHSTGWGVYNEGHVAEWIDNYNSEHTTSYELAERSYPDSPYPWDNYPYDYWNLWINNACDNSNPGIACMDNLCASYDVIIFKHCYPGAAITNDESQPSAGSAVKSLANYKLQYRDLRDLMDSYPDKKFIVWTLAPLHRLATNATASSRARAFVDWVKNDWLTEDGKPHPNIYIFDFYGYLAESDPSPAQGMVNCLKYEYEFLHENTDDSHPNTAANEYAGPLFAQFMVNTIEDTPEVPTAMKNEKADFQFTWSMNPGFLEITLNEEKNYHSLEVHDATGKLVESRLITQKTVNVATSSLPSGMYIVTLLGENNRRNFKISKN